MLVRVAEAERKVLSILQYILRAMYRKLSPGALRRPFYYFSSEMRKSLGSWVQPVSQISPFDHILCGFPKDTVKSRMAGVQGKVGMATGWALGSSGP